MATVATKQISFAGGQIRDTLQYRNDQSKVVTGCALILNMIVRADGTLFSRPGSKYIARVKNDNEFALLQEWIYSVGQSYCLEIGYDALYEDGTGTPVGHAYIRFIFEGSQLVIPAATAWADATPYAIGDLVSFGGSNYYCMVAHTSSTAGGNEPDDAGGTGYWYLLTDDPDVVGGSIFEVPLPYASGDIAELNFAQSADVMWITHWDWPPYRLTRVDQTEWVIDIPPPGSSKVQPTLVSLTGDGAVGAGDVKRYMVTAVSTKSKDFEESLPGHLAAAVGTGDLSGGETGDVNIAIATHGLASGDWVYVSAVTADAGTTPHPQLKSVLLGGVFQVSKVDANNLTFDDTMGVVFTAASHTATIHKAYLETTTADDPLTLSQHIIVNWTDAGITGIKGFNVYREVNGVFSLLGQTTKVVYVDNGQTEPDPTITPPRWNPQWLLDDKHPAVVSFHKNRKWYARSRSEPQTIWASVADDLENFTRHSPALATDSITITIPASGNQISHLLDMGGVLVVITRGAKHALEGNGDGVLAADDLPNLKRFASGGGALQPPPLVIQETALYVVQGHIKVRDLREELDGLRGRDLTIYASDLFGVGCGCRTVDWAYQETPHSVVWLVRQDGRLLGLTYVKEEDIWAWHQHNTVGKWRSVAVTPENQDRVVNLIAEREIDGETVRYIERVSSVCEECPG